MWMPSVPQGGPSEGWVQRGFAHNCMLLAPRKLANTAAFMSIRNEVSVCVHVRVRTRAYVCACVCNLHYFLGRIPYLQSSISLSNNVILSGVTAYGMGGL